jgi:RNA polymerase sigma-70 factor (ECF subfamily)
LSIDATDEELIALLADNSDLAIERIFQKYYEYLCNIIYRYLRDGALAEDLAQDVFMELWRKQESIQIKTSLKAYLKRAAVNKTLNFLRDNKITFDGEEELPDIQGNTTSVTEKMEAEELQEQINQAIDGLPERCRMIFLLSRFEDMSYKEIAQKLDVSVKTVENQISKALKILRVALGPFLSLMLIWLGA